jgi:hypothetical protein
VIDYIGSEWYCDTASIDFLFSPMEGLQDPLVLDTDTSIAGWR